MASAGVHLPLWDKNNVEQRGFILESELNKLLVQATPGLKKKLKLDDVWAHLEDLSVLELHDIETIKHKKARPGQVEELIRHIRTGGECRQYHALMRAMALTGQGHLIPGMDTTVYYPEEDQAAASHLETLRLSQQFLKAIKIQSDYYARTIMKGHLFDLKQLGIRYDINDCYIPVAASEDGYFRDRKELPSEKILVVEPGNPKLRTVLLSGSTGSGKSTTVRRIAYKWSKQKEEEREWDLVVLLNLQTLKLTPGASTQENIKESIRQSLVGNVEKDDIMDNLDNKQFRVLLITDNLDEYHDQETVVMMREMVEETHKGNTNYTMLVACRSGLCPIEEDFFDRHVKLDGFTLADGLKYVKQLYSKCQKPPDSTVLEYIIANKDNLDHILTNPMFTHIFSIVTSNGTLTPTKGQILSKTDILRALVTTLTERQLEKNKNPEDDLQEELPGIDLESQATRFYNMCLFALSKDIRPIKEELLAQFGIDRTNPLLSFLEVKTTFNNRYKQTTEWHFTHIVFLEYFATCALERLSDDIFEHCVLLLCCNQQFCNVQRLLFSTLGRTPEQVHRLSSMIQATLLLQSRQDGSESMRNLKEIQDAMKPVIDINSVCEVLLPKAGNCEKLEAPQVSEKVKLLWDEIRCFYGQNAEKSQDSGLFSAMCRDHQVIKHIFECLHEVPEELQQLIFSDSITCLLPSKHHDKSGTSKTIYATGDTMWTEIKENGDGICIYTSCLSDACQAIAQHSKLHTGLAELESSKSHRKLDDEKKECRIVFQAELTNLWYPSSQLGTGKWEPLRQFLSNASWSALFDDLSHLSTKVDKLNVHWNRTHKVSAIAFLNCLLLEDAQTLLRDLLTEQDGWLDIQLEIGQIDIKDLTEWRSSYLRQDRVRIQLLELRCDNQNSHPLAEDCEVPLHNTVHGGCRLVSGLIMSNPGGFVTCFRTTDVTETRSVLASTEAELQPVRDESSKPRCDIKIVAVGDGASGKSCLFLSFWDGRFPTEYIPTVFDDYATDTKVDAQDCHLGLWDTAGQQDYDRLRPLSYPDTDIFLLCYNIASPSTLNNIYYKWYGEVRHHCPDTPSVVVGCQLDLRSDPETRERLAKIRLAPIDFKQGKKTADRIGARGYFECSALTGEGVEELFEAVTRIVLLQKDDSKAPAENRKTEKQKNRKKCCCLV